MNTCSVQCVSDCYSGVKVKLYFFIHFQLLLAKKQLEEVYMSIYCCMKQVIYIEQ